LLVISLCDIKGVIQQPETEVSPGPLANKPSPAVSIPLTPIHFGTTLTANNLTSEVFKDSICPLFISKETR